VLEHCWRCPEPPCTGKHFALPRNGIAYPGPGWPARVQSFEVLWRVRPPFQRPRPIITRRSVRSANFPSSRTRRLPPGPGPRLPYPSASARTGPAAPGPGPRLPPVPRSTRRTDHATRRRNRPTAGEKAGVRPRAAASLADHYHSASEHGIIGRRIETVVAGRFRRGHPGLWRGRGAWHAAPCVEPGGRGWENGGDEAADRRRSA
jgi:hypothetical protein